MPVRVGEVINIPVCWESADDAFASQKAEVRAIVADTWEKVSLISFLGWNSCATSGDKSVRISIEDTGPHTRWLGRELVNVPEGVVLNFTFQDWKPSAWCLASDDNKQTCIKAIAVHEFGHVLSLAHEQNRDDTPKECGESPSGQSGDTLLTPWDPDSIMNYCHVIYAPQGWKLSDKDIASIQTMYGARM